ncbi:MAG: DUF6011 domain-containing protein [Betaproteobacteria bacterium]
MITGEHINELHGLLGNLRASDRTFAESLISYFRRNGFVTDKQAPHVSRLLDTARGAATTPASYSLPRILGILMHAANHDVKRVRIVLKLSDGERVRLGYSRNKQTAYITSLDFNDVWNGESKARYYGKLERGGKWTPTRKAADHAALKAKLAEFDKDPHKAGAVEGHATGACCFCSRYLTTAASVQAGYGPICAERFGLPWGDGTNARNVFERVADYQDGETESDEEDSKINESVTLFRKTLLTRLA